MSINFLQVGETLPFSCDACMSVITIRLNDGSDKPRSHDRAISGKTCLEFAKGRRVQEKMALARAHGLGSNGLLQNLYFTLDALTQFSFCCFEIITYL